ncbi:response regulator [Paenibacillus arenilitoris]|nr:response regulator [Paenibacillus arenilitoris]
MYKILIAEDSKPILRHIKELLQSSELPVQVAHTASNGEDALQGLRRLDIDILITDIRMPKLDGLALIEEAKKLRPGLKAVLISGYNDFEYTRKAINLQVADYLLKPVERGALTEVMERVIGQLGEQLLKEIAVLDEVIDPAVGRELTLHPRFFRHKKLVFVLHLQYFQEAAPVYRPDHIQNVLNRSFAPHPLWVFATSKPKEMLVLADPAMLEGTAATMELLARIRAPLAEGGLPVSVAGHFEPAAASEIAGCYRALSGLLENRLSVAEPCLADAAHPAALPPEAPGDFERLAARYADKIQKLQKEPFLRQLEEQLLKWGRSNARIARLQRFVALLADAFATHRPAAGWRNDRLYRSEAMALFEKVSYGEFCSGLLALTEDWFAELQSLNKKGGNELFGQIDDYLRASLYSQVSLNELSAAFHVSPSYISRVVKKFARRTLMQHYLNLKIEEARKVMQSKPSIKIKELSDALCFYDQHYFSKVFKEYAGCSPSEFKATLDGAEP